MNIDPVIAIFLAIFIFAVGVNVGLRIARYTAERVLDILRTQENDKP